MFYVITNTVVYTKENNNSLIYIQFLSLSSIVMDGIKETELDISIISESLVNLLINLRKTSIV